MSKIIRCGRVGTLVPVVLVIAGALPLRAHAGQSPKPPGALGELSLAELMDVEVTSAARKSQNLANTTAAVTVLTAEDIRRSGATTLPEALRLVPGLQVAQFDSAKWAVSSRGFNDLFANKMLALIDGRSIYTPLFAGVFWDAQDIVLEDIARIEVVRGPGAAMWGVNAVNGVVNVITRSASDTQGVYAEAIAGTRERGLGALRYGGSFSSSLRYRVEAKYMNRDSVELADTKPMTTVGWRSIYGGFRLDWLGGGGSDAFFEGGAHDGSEEELFRDASSEGAPARVGRQAFSGGHALARWRRVLPGDEEVVLQLYYDRSERSATERLQELRETVDVDFQHSFPLGSGHDLMWGLALRRSRDELGETALLTAVPAGRSLRLAGGFLQDEIALIPSTLTLTLGSKLDWNDYSGFELQPTLRVLGRLAPNQSLWAAASRAVRMPSRAERELHVALGIGGSGPGASYALQLEPTRGFESEELFAYEMGYRWSRGPKLSLDVAGFHNRYSDLAVLRPVEAALAFDDNGIPVISQEFDNGALAATHGVEIASTFRPASCCSVTGWYTWLATDFEAPGDSGGGVGPVGGSPSHQFQLRSALDLSPAVELDVRAHYVDELEAYSVPAYLRLDVRVGWSLTSRLELSVSGSNLLDDRHREFGPSGFWNAGDVRRGIYGKLAVRF